MSIYNCDICAKVIDTDLEELYGLDKDLNACEQCFEAAQDD